MELVRLLQLAILLVLHSIGANGYQCVTDESLGSISQGAVKGLTVDPDTLQFCPDQLQPIWPNTGNALRTIRLPQVWKSSWSATDRSDALAHLLSLLDETGATVLVGVPITCDGQDDAKIWQYTQAFLSSLGVEQLAGLSIGEAVDVIADGEVTNGEECQQRMWEDGQFWRNFTEIVTTFDSLGFSSVPITTILSPAALVGSPFAEVSGSLRAKSFLQNATRRYGTRFAFSFNANSFTEMMPQASSACSQQLSSAMCWGQACTVPAQMRTMRNKMEALTESSDYDLWLTEVGWSSDSDDFASDDDATCPGWASLSRLESFYEDFLSWDGSIGSSYKSPQLVFWSAMRGGSRRFPGSGLVPSCDRQRCTIYSDDFVLFQFSLHSGPAKVYCADTALFNGWATGEDGCQSKCELLDDCQYASIWPEWHYGVHWCRLTATCSSTASTDMLVSVYLKEQMMEVPDPLPVLKPTTTSTATTATQTTTTKTTTTKTTTTKTRTTTTKTSTTRTSTSTKTTTTRTRTTTTRTSTTKTWTQTTTTRTTTITTTTRTSTTTTTTKTKTSSTRTTTTTATTTTRTQTQTTTQTSTTRTRTTTTVTGTTTTVTSSTTTKTSTTTSTRTATSTTSTSSMTVTISTTTTTSTSTTITRVACEFENEPNIGYYWDTSCRMGDLGCNADGLSVQCRFCGSGEFKNLSCPASLCSFPNEPVIPYYWDGDCKLGDLGCWADGIHPQCRFCGNQPYTSIVCPAHAQILDIPACDFDEEPAYPYYWEPQCIEGLLGCNADDRHLSCRFCGEGPYTSVDCPADDRCTFLNPPALPNYWDDDCEMGVLGCMADGIHVKCRFCEHRPFENITCPEALVPAAKECYFPEGSIPRTPFYWDDSCKMGLLGCWADGIHAECRFCGEGPYSNVSCPISDDENVLSTLSWNEDASKEHRSSSSPVEKSLDVNPELGRLEPEEHLSGAQGLRAPSIFFLISIVAQSLPAVLLAFPLLRS